MKKYLLFLLTLLAVWSCSNEDVMHNGIAISGTTTPFVKLVDTDMQNAGIIKIVADAPEAELTWITSPVCNLDTTQTIVTMKNGIGALSVKWLNKQDNGQYAPENTMFRAWVRIKTGDRLTDVPLILAEEVDSVKLMNSIQTRSTEIQPRVNSISFDPGEVVMQADGGFTMMTLDGPGTVNLDYTKITENMRIDRTNLETTANASKQLDFKWIDNTPPTEPFSVVVTVKDLEAGAWGAFIISYDPTGGGGQNLQYQSNNMPAAGNLPSTSNVYTFTFTGTYTGKIQLRTLSNGTVLNTAKAYDYPANQPRARVPENKDAERPILFEYKAGTGAWTTIPGVNRIQDGNGGVTPPPVPGTKPNFTPISPAGDIPDAGGGYSSVFSNYVGQVIFRAVSGKGRLFDSKTIDMTAGSVIQSVLTIPEATSMSDNMVIFQYSTDGNNWTDMETRKQIVESFASGSFNDMPMTIPVTGGTYHYGSSGTLSALLTIVAKDDNGVVLAEVKGAVGTRIPVTIPANKTGRARSIFLWYIRGDQPGKYNYIMRADQAGI